MPGNLYMPIGIPASGKSTWRAEMVRDRNVTVISPDDIRMELYGEPGVNTPDIWEEAFKRTGECLKDGKECFFDATSISKWERGNLIEVAKEHGSSVRARVFLIHPRIAYLRNLKRDRKVPEYVVWMMAKKMEMPDKAEGIDEIEIVKRWGSDGECLESGGELNGGCRWIDTESGAIEGDW